MLSLRYLSWCELHSGHIHFLLIRFLTSLFWYLQLEQSWLLGKFFATVMTCLPYQRALYSSILRNSAQLTSAIDLARRLFLIILLTCKSSIPITSWFLTIVVVSFCKKSFLLF